MSPAKLINGTAIAEQIREALKPRLEALRMQGIIPGLAVVLVGDDPSSQVYVGMKTKAFAALNLVSETFHLPAQTDQTTILQLIRDLNSDPRFHGILVQLPLPNHLDSSTIIESINPAKDADGLHPTNLGRLMIGGECPLPCTPHGILKLLQYSGIETAGRNVVILGRSNIVGKPIANLLFQKRALGNATVTICHTHTRNLPEITRQADILIAAMGKAEFVTRDFVKPGVVVIDVGVNRVEDSTARKGYRLVGDVKFDEVAEVAAAITPVPGGVGPMTIAMLIANTVLLAEKSIIKN